MPLSLPQARALADQLCDELLNRSRDVDRATSYYRGEQTLRFVSKEFAKYFGDRYRNFSDNWVGVVADAPVERLELVGIKPYGQDSADDESWRVWMENDLDVDSQLGYLGAGNAARSFALVWFGPDDDVPQVTFEDASQAIVAYRPGSRRDRIAALKRWQDGNIEYATLYLPDEVWRLERPLTKQRKTTAEVNLDELTIQWELREAGESFGPEPNPLGVVPMVELVNRPLLADAPLSDVLGVADMQDAINFLWALLFNAADFASFPQRVVLGAEAPFTPILDEAGKVIGKRPVPMEKFSVERLLWVTGEHAKIDSWNAADLSAYTDVLEVAVGHIAAQTRTPAHYLIGKMANLSGDALIAAETGLVKKCQEKQLWFGAAQRELFRLIALAQGDDRRARALRAGKVLWRDAESRSMAQLTDSLVKLKQVGFPFEALAARYGLTPPEIVDLMQMREREAAQDPLMQAMNGRSDLGVEPDKGIADDGDA